MAITISHISDFSVNQWEMYGINIPQSILHKNWQMKVKFNNLLKCILALFKLKNFKYSLVHSTDHKHINFSSPKHYSVYEL